MLTRWDPFRELSSFRSEMDNLFDRFFSDRSRSAWLQDNQQSYNWGFDLDVSENDDEYLVKGSMPGVNPDNIEINYTGNTLTISAETKEEKQEDQRYHLRERRYGRFMRSITLPNRVNPDAIKAEYDQGILTLHLPKSEEMKPKRIPISTGASSQKVLEGNFQKENGKGKSK